MNEIKKNRWLIVVALGVVLMLAMGGGAQLFAGEPTYQQRRDKLIEEEKTVEEAIEACKKQLRDKNLEENMRAMVKDALKQLHDRLRTIDYQKESNEIQEAPFVFLYVAWDHNRKRIEELNRRIEAMFSVGRFGRPAYELFFSKEDAREKYEQFVLELNHLLRLTKGIETEIRHRYFDDIGPSCGLSVDFCFAAHTKVIMSDGSLRPISQIKVGEKVRSYDLQTGSAVIGKVVKVYSFENHNPCYLVNNSIVTTGPHHFLVQASPRDWKLVSNLVPGDGMVTEKGLVALESIENIKPFPRLYNLRVEHYRNYMVTDGQNNYVVRDYAYE